MKSTELRIGNWIHHKYSEPNFIVSVINTFNENTVNGIELEDCEPVPLTEEWLLKFGFDGESEYFNLNGISVEQSGNDGKWCIYMFDEYHSVESALALIQYVHQLQNLYFSLTNEELTL